MTRRACSVILGGLWSLLTPLSGAAHGPAPAVLGVVADDAGDLRVMLLSRGLAQRDSEGRWRFVCSEAWSGPETVLAASADAETSFVVANDDVFALVQGGAPEAIGLPEPTFEIRRLVSGPDAVYALVAGSEESTLWRLAPAGASVVVWRSSARPVTVDSMGEALITGHVDDDLLVLDTVSLDGRLLAHAEVDIGDAAQLTPSLRVAGDRVFALLSRGEDYRLGVVEEVTWRELLRSDSPVHGPVATGGAAVLTIDGTLYELAPDGTMTSLSSSRRYTCLGTSALGAWACAQEELYALAADGHVLEPAVFEVESLWAPRLERISEAARPACHSEWLDLAIEVGIDPAAATPPDSMPPPNDDGGCRLVGGLSSPARLWPFALLTGLAVSRRVDRRRRVGGGAARRETQRRAALAGD